MEEFFRARLPTQRARSLRYKVSVSGCCGAAAKIWKMYSCTAFAGEQKETWETSTFASFFKFLFFMLSCQHFVLFCFRECLSEICQSILFSLEKKTRNPCWSHDESDGLKVMLSPRASKKRWVKWREGHWPWVGGTSPLEGPRIPFHWSTFGSQLILLFVGCNISQQHWLFEILYDASLTSFHLQGECLWLWPRKFKSSRSRGNFPFPHCQSPLKTALLYWPEPIQIEGAQYFWI